jgi:protein SCO1/2
MSGRRILAWSALALSVALASCGAPAGGDPAAGSSEADALPPGLVAGESLQALDSTFLDQSGREVTLASYGDRPVVLAMVYTRCRSACPRLVADLQGIERRLPAAKRDHTWFVLVSLDPLHDRPDTLAAFAREHALDPSRWRLLTGSREAVRDLAAVLGVKVREDGDGAIAHSSNVYLLDPGGVVRAAVVGLGADAGAFVAARRAMP